MDFLKLFSDWFLDAVCQFWLTGKITRRSSSQLSYDWGEFEARLIDCMATLSHNILCSKLKQVNINPYIINWLISFFRLEKAESCCRWLPYWICSLITGVPQGTVLGPVLFSIFINDIKAVNTNKNLLVKNADDVTVSFPIEANVGLDESAGKGSPNRYWIAREQLHELQFDKNMGTCFTRKDYQDASWTTRDHREERKTETSGRYLWASVS